jgi:hypothetical protein
VSSRLHVSSRWLFVVLCSLAWIGFTLWLMIPLIDDMGRTISVPVTLALIVGLWLIPGVLQVRWFSFLLFDEDPEQPPDGRHA